MASIVRMEKNNQVYVYESKSYWDKKKKATRTRMTYLGKEDPSTKEIISPGRKWTPKSSRDYGSVFLLSRASMRIGLTKTLREAFPNDWKSILACSFFEVSEGKPLYLCNVWLESTYNELVDRLPSQRISDLLKSVGENLQARLEFSRLWTQERRDDKFIVFDITSISSYSELIESVEWGYNRDKENLPQVNLGMVFGQPSLLPIFYNVYQGSIRDVSTLQNILKFLAYFEFTKVTFIMDKGFYSAENIVGMKKKRLNFIIALPFSVNQAQNLIEKHENDITDVSNAFRVNKDILYCVRDKITIEEITLNAYMYFDKRRKLDSEERLLKKIMEAEEKVENKHFEQRKRAEKYISENLKGLKEFFEIRKAKHAFVLRRDREEIQKAIRRMGHVVILSSRSMKREEIIWLYRNKDCVEKCFDNMKNELSTNRLRVHSQESMEGRLFVSFITLILYSWMNKTMHKGLSKKYTIEEVMYEVKKLKIIQLANGNQVLTETSKNQRNLFKKLVDEVPAL